MLRELLLRVPRNGEKNTSPTAVISRTSRKNERKRKTMFSLKILRIDKYFQVSKYEYKLLKYVAVIN